MSVDRNRLAAQAKMGDAAAERALQVTRRTSFMLSGAQLGITATGLLVGYVAEPLVGESLGVLLGGGGIPRTVSVVVGTVGVLAAATLVQMLFGELYPKNLAIANPEPLSRALARSTLIYLTIFGWLVAFFDFAANALLRLVRIEPIHDLDSTATAQDLERIVADSRDSGDLPPELSVLLDRILDFPERDVEHAMVPRARVDSISPTTTVAETRALMAQAHTRYPVVDADGQPTGVVHLVDLLRSDADGDVQVTEVMRDAIVVPELMPLPAAVEELRAAGEELACVIDEYGGFAGILTVEDLAEELVGEITDEHDAELPDLIVADGDREWVMDGDAHLDEVERAVGRQIPEGDYETIAGLVIAELGDLPEVGQQVRVALPQDAEELVAGDLTEHALEIEVLAVARHVPDQVLVRLVDRDPSEEPVGDQPDDDSQGGESAREHDGDADR